MIFDNFICFLLLSVYFPMFSYLSLLSNVLLPQSTFLWHYERYVAFKKLFYFIFVILNYVLL